MKTELPFSFSPGAVAAPAVDVERRHRRRQHDGRGHGQQHAGAEQGHRVARLFSPGMSVCTGFTAAGLPTNAQVGGRYFDEATVLRVAHAFEAATAWRDRRPVLGER